MTQVMSPEFMAPNFQPEAASILTDQIASEVPRELLGFNIAAVQRFGGIAMRTGLMPEAIGSKLYKLDQAADLFDLAVAVKEGKPFTYEDLQENIAPITELSPKMKLVNNLAQHDFFRDWIMKKLNERITKKADSALEIAREKVNKMTSLEGNVEHIASFVNPREQFTSEFNELAETVHGAIIEQHDLRVQSGIVKEAQSAPPKGIKGICVKVYRKIKSFFGFLKSGGHPKLNSEITSYDVGAGIEKVYTRLATDKGFSAQQLPLMSKFLDGHLTKYLANVTKDNLAFAAPELLAFFSSLSPAKEKWQSMIESANRHSHEFRFLTRFVKHYKSYSLSGIEEATTNLLPAFRDILPTEGRKLRQAFEQLQQLLQPSTRVASPEGETGTQKHPLKKQIVVMYEGLRDTHPAVPRVASIVREVFSDIQRFIQQKRQDGPNTKSLGRLRRISSRT